MMLRTFQGSSNTILRKYYSILSSRHSPLQHLPNWGKVEFTYRFKSSMPLYDDDHSNKERIPFILADIGEGIAEVEVLQWFVQPGDHVKQFDKVCEVQSDKATVEITSRYEGIVESLADSNDMIRVGSPLLHFWVESKANDHLSLSPKGTMHNQDFEQDKLRIPVLPSSYERPKMLATPAVRKLCREYNLDLGNVVGTGPNGRVLKADVLQILQNSGRIDVTPSLLETSPINPITLCETDAVTTSYQSTDETVPIRGYNRLMVKTMIESLSIPHMCYADEINMSQVLVARKAVEGIKLSILPFAIKAASLAILEYPIMNSSLNLEEMTITFHANHNIGIAMDTPRGLTVPVIHGCQKLSIVDIAKELDRLKAQVRKLITHRDKISYPKKTLLMMKQYSLPPLP
jgi:2-oxoisovalerate dehydrogenase E2 component (dihydrolipoyl transacylase)